MESIHFNPFQIFNSLIGSYQKQWINFTPIIIFLKIRNCVKKMLTCFLRIGPLVFLQLVLMGTVVALYLEGTSPNCYYFSLGYFSLTTYIIEMIVSLRMIKTNSQMREKYVRQVVAQDYMAYLAKLIWNNVNIILVLMLLYCAPVEDGIHLAGFQNHPSEQIGLSLEGKQQLSCEFTLYSLCLFVQVGNKTDLSQQQTMILWLLYAVTVFINSLICIIFSKEYYHYCSILTHNRKLSAMIEGGLTETLLDCNVYDLKMTAISQKMEDQIGECAICLHLLVQANKSVETIDEMQRVIKLRCGHIFHNECIHKWLKVRDHCPYRCSPSL